MISERVAPEYFRECMLDPNWETNMASMGNSFNFAGSSMSFGSALLDDNKLATVREVREVREVGDVGEVGEVGNGRRRPKPGRSWFDIKSAHGGAGGAAGWCNSERGRPRATTG